MICYMFDTKNKNIKSILMLSFFIPQIVFLSNHKKLEFQVWYSIQDVILYRNPKLAVF